ncbi:MAG: histidinol-phosphatase [Eubacterium sp.]|nr:histidinol-phosphatase [Eubacterium sp.]
MRNYHTHTTRCRHAFGKDRDYIDKAIKAGITELGFSDHAPMLFPVDNYYSTYRMFPEDVADYVNSIKLLREEYKDKIKIYLGYEFEYFPELFDKTIEFLNKCGYEYLILGQHFTDNEYEPYAHYSGLPTNDETLFDKYINQVLEGLKTGKFLYIAHPDLFNYTGPDRIYIEKMTYLCKEIKKLGYPVEFNLLGFAQRRNYPDKRFWKIVSEVGNDVIIGFDAHSPEAFQNKRIYNSALKYLAKLGITPLEKLEINAACD